MNLHPGNRTRFAWLLGLSLCFASPAAAVAPPIIACDLYGDPLPEGAVVRLGTVNLRLRQSDQVTRLSFSPDGKHFFAADPVRDSIHVWKTATGKHARTLLGWCPDHLGMLTPDGKCFVTQPYDRSSIDLRDVQSSRIVRQFRVPRLSPVSALAFSPDSKTMAAGSITRFGEAEAVRLWDVASGKRRQDFEGVRHVRDMAFSPDGRFLAWITRGGIVCFRKTATGEEIARRRLRGPKREWDSAVHRWVLSFSPTGETLLISAGRHVQIWNATSGSLLGRVAAPGGSGTALAWAGDGRTVGIGGKEGIHLWDVRQQKSRLLHQGAYITALAFSPDSRLLVSGENDGGIRVWDVATGQQLLPGPGHVKAAYSVQFSPDGRTIVTSGEDDSVRLWDAHTGRQLACIQETGPDRILGRYGFAFSPDGKTLTMLTADEALVVWSLKPLRKLRRLPPGERSIHGFVHSPHGNRLALFTSGPAVRICDFVTGRALTAFVPPAAAVSRHFNPAWSLLAFSPTRPDRLAAVALDTDIALFDPSTGKEALRLRGCTGGVNALGFSPCGALLLSCSGAGLATGGQASDNFCRLWNVETGRELARIPCGEYLALSIAVSPDGQLVATANGDIHVHEINSGKLVFRGRETKNPPRAVAFSPDGRRVAGAMENGTALVWDLDPKPGHPSKRSLEALWADLSSADAALAYRSGLALARTEGVVRFLAGKLPPVSPPDPARIKKWIEDLDDEDFHRREKASKELLRLGEWAEPHFHKAIKQPASLEVYYRVKGLLAALPPWLLGEGETLRRVRAIGVLGRVGTVEARALLKKLADGAPEPRQQQAARRVLASRWTGGQ
jgi:WD40 repeat protein